MKVKHIWQSEMWNTVWWLSLTDMGRLWECFSARYAQLPKFKQTGVALILTISTHHSASLPSWEPPNCCFFPPPPIFPEISLPLYSTRYRWKIWSPWDFVWRRASAPSSPGIQQDYTVIISISIPCDSLFYVRDLQSCFINSAWMKPHFKHRGA